MIKAAGHDYQGFACVHVKSKEHVYVEFTFDVVKPNIYLHKKKWWGDLLLWAGLYLLWVVVLQNRALVFGRTLTVEFCYLVFIAANYYFHIYYTIPFFLHKNRYVAFGAILLSAIAISALLRSLVARYINSHFFLAGKQQPPFHIVYFNSLVNIFFWVIALISIYLINEKKRFNKYLDRIEKEKTFNELNFLRAQFNPHFLFNSIHSIYGHIDKGNSLARNMLLTFSEMLRYQLYECNVDLIDIAREIDYIRNYVSMQQTRKENLVVKLDLSKHNGGKIAPMLFIAFIENAFKYVGANEGAKNMITIFLCSTENELKFSVCNTKEKNNGMRMDHKGIGIANVKRRLELLYPGKHELVIKDEPDYFDVNLKIDLA